MDGAAATLCDLRRRPPPITAAQPKKEIFTVSDLADDLVVAIVGMAGRFPGAAGAGELWQNLLTGVSGLREITDAELAAAGVSPAAAAGPGYVRMGGPVDGIELLDASAFGLSRREAETMEPHHRLLLECSWEALERAGYCPTDPGLPVGVFAGAGFPDYLTRHLPRLAAGVERDSLTSLISYKLGLRGPSLTVQTYCSTSLVAVHLACQSLLVRECGLALAGGAFLPLPQPAGYHFEEDGIMSPDGQVRSLDAAANGTVMGSGVAVVALRRLADALADGDVVHAVILGSAVNNDGRDRAGYAAPGVTGQATVIETALAVAGVKPESIGYVECHAVGTLLGDSIELTALSRVFGTARENPCVLSSVKPSIGHLDRAAGATGLIRAALSLRSRLLPATAGFRTPNPALAPALDRFTVLTGNRDWPAGPQPRRAGVSSFGLGGTNAHVVLQEAPPRPGRPPRPGPHLLTLSAIDSAALEALTGRLRAHLASGDDADLADVAYTLQISRSRFALRRAVVVRDRADAIAALADPARWIDGETRRRDPVVRLVPPTGVTDEWLAGLGAAGCPLAGGAAGGAGGLVALADGLRRLGVRLAGPGEPAAAEISVAPGPGPATGWVLAVLARLWLAGSVIDWAGLHRGGGQRVELPPYPFQRRRYWIDPPDSGPALISVPAAGRPLPSRHPGPPSAGGLDRRLRAAGPWLVLAADARGRTLAERLGYAGAEVVTVTPGGRLVADEAGDFTVRPADRGDLAGLLGSLVATPRTVVHGFSLAGDDPAGELGEASVTALAAALTAATALPPVELILLTSGAVGVPGPGLEQRERAGVAALAPRLAGQDRFLGCRHIAVGADADLDQVLARAVGRTGFRGDGSPAGAGTLVSGGLEGGVAAVWADVLGLAEVGAEDNFFDLGGRSPAAVEIAARLRAGFCAGLAVTAVLEYPTVRLLSTHIAEQEGSHRQPASGR